VYVWLSFHLFVFFAFDQLLAFSYLKSAMLNTPRLLFLSVQYFVRAWYSIVLRFRPERANLTLALPMPETEKNSSEED